MKIAIIGNTLAAISSLIHFDQLEANLTWYSDGNGPAELGKGEQLQGELPKALLSDEFPGWVESKGLLLAGQSEQIWENWDVFRSWVEQQFLPWFQQNHQWTPAKVVRAHKRFWDQFENIPDHGPMIDLFRVVIEQKHDRQVEQIAQENPELIKGLSERVRSSLKGSLEYFSDYDALIMASDRFLRPNSIGPGQHQAVGERYLADSEVVTYGLDAFDENDNHLRTVKQTESIAIIGSGLLALQKAIELSQGLLEGSIERVFLITNEYQLFQRLRGERPDLLEQWDKVQEKMQAKFDQEIQRFYSELEQWQSLESYEKAKIKKPQEPIPFFVPLPGHNITAVDRLIDQEKVFLTCEVPSFRIKQVQDENAQFPLKTLSLDRVFVLTGFLPDNDWAYLEDTIGAYFIHPNEKNTEDRLKVIESDLLQYFKRS
jgi:hypothetical protein